ncbi:SH3 domain-containing protein [Gemella sp. GH3]|uniref:SH3 domain-containing protein n=1 Tax=unclassified Gemella TaxID=2624949 RepID=UPI0015CFCBDF|nr:MULTISPECIES: SH3 domain-containing protein [unclassified Gemella]MBF0714479.1 SH3 domain-containing protein [Gemella sp. GH3.1]NYS51431.1 SH3 domain-containing protein [Gemella sp. GH3]
MVTQTQAINWTKSKIGGRVDWDGYYGSQCVDLIMAYVGELWKGRVNGNAIHYVNNTLPNGFKRYKKGQVTIQPGDIIVWNMTLPWGHIGICTAVNGNLLTCVEQNVDGNADALTRGGPARVVNRYDSLVAAIIRPPYTIDSANNRNWTRVPEQWHFTVEVDELNVREAPSLNSKVVATYKKGDIINYDSYCIANGFVWISYIGSSGQRRYVATGIFTNNRNQMDYGHFR